MPSVCWWTPNFYIPDQSSTPNSRLIYLILLAIFVYSLTVNILCWQSSQTAHSKLNSPTELVLPQQMAISILKPCFTLFSLTSTSNLSPSPVGSAFRIQAKVEHISPLSFLPPSWSKPSPLSSGLLELPSWFPCCYTCLSPVCFQPSSQNDALKA